MLSVTNFTEYTYKCPVCQDTAFVPGKGHGQYTSTKPCTDCQAGVSVSRGWYSNEADKHKYKKPKPQNSLLPSARPDKGSAWHAWSLENRSIPQLVQEAKTVEKERRQVVKQTLLEIENEYKDLELDENEEEPPF